MSSTRSQVSAKDHGLPTGYRDVIRVAWNEAKLGGACYCRQVKGAFSVAVVIHHGRAFDDSRYDYDAGMRFVENCRRQLQRRGAQIDLFLFQLENPSGRYRLFPFEKNDLDRIILQAQIVADRLPRDRWDATQDADWERVVYNGDRIEMWEKGVERSGRLYRVREGGWTSIQMNASYFDEITYVGVRRGAMLYAGFAA